MTWCRSYRKVTGHRIVSYQSGGVGPVTGHGPVSYPERMTTKGQPGRVIRIDDETWAAYEEVCAEKGVARATDIRMYVKREVAAFRRRQRDEAAARRIAES